MVALDGVTALLAKQCVVAISTEDDVAITIGCIPTTSIVTEDDVITTTAIDTVTACSTKDGVISLATLDGVIAKLPLDDVIANSAIGRVVTNSTEDEVSPPITIVYAICIVAVNEVISLVCLLYTSPSPRDQRGSRMPSSA